MSGEQTTEHRVRRRVTPVVVLISGATALVLGLVVFVFWLLPQWEFDEDPSTTPTTAGETVEVDSPPSRSPGTYIEADVNFPDTLNPLLATTQSEQNAAALLYRGLFIIGPDGSPRPDIATQITISEDRLEYEVELSQDSVWHDGEPITVDDVLFTIQLVQHPDFPGNEDRAQFWRAITAERVDDFHVTFRLTEPYAGFANYLKLPILPKHVFSGMLPEDMADQPIEPSLLIGSGPYSVSDVNVEDETINFQAFESNDMSPEINEIVVHYFEDRTLAMDAFRAGIVDGISYVPVNMLSDSSLFPESARVYAPTLPGYTALYFNIRNPLLRDENVRRGLEAAIDRQLIVDSILGGNGIPATSPIPEMLAAHSPGNHLGFDREHALELFSESGWELNHDDQLLYREGQPFVIPILVDENHGQRMAIAISLQESLREVGVALDIQALSGTQVQELLDARQYAMVLLGWRTETGDPDCFQMWHSSQIDDGLNFTGFADNRADEVLVAARQTIDEEERTRHYATFQEVFAEQVPAVVLFYPRYHFAVTGRVEGAEPYPLVNPSDRMRYIAQWQLMDPDAQP